MLAPLENLADALSGDGSGMGWGECLLLYIWENVLTMGWHKEQE